MEGSEESGAGEENIVVFGGLRGDVFKYSEIGMSLVLPPNNTLKDEAGREVRVFREKGREGKRDI